MSGDVARLLLMLYGQAFLAGLLSYSDGVAYVTIDCTIPEPYGTVVRK
jgi:hypothetical protein